MERKSLLTIITILLALSLFARCGTTNNNTYNQPCDSSDEMLEGDSIAISIISDLKRDNLKNNSLKYSKVFTQSMLSEENTIYIVKHDYDLKGKAITVPDNCILEFRGGCLRNGTLVGQRTTIKNDLGGVVFKEIAFTGKYLQNYISSEWFKYNDLCDLFDAIEVLATSDIQTIVEVKETKTTYTPLVRSYYQGEKEGYLFKIPSNTKVDFCGSELTLAPNDISFFYAMYIKDVCNIEVKNLTLIGDIEAHTPTRYNEYLHGIYIYSAQNIKLDNIIATKFWGDGLGISGYSDASRLVNTNISVTNCHFIKNRRQGCSISKGHNLYFDNCAFLETGTIKGTSPSAGVDIEPNNGSDVLKNIVFNNCKFLGNEGEYGGLLIMTANLTNDLDAEEIKLTNCEIDGIHQYGKGGGLLKSCVIRNSKNRENCLNASKNQVVENCTIEFRKDNLKTRISNNTRFTNNRILVR